MEIQFKLRTAMLWVITQQVVVIPYRRFGTTYRPRLQGSRIQKKSHAQFKLFSDLINVPKLEIFFY